MTLPLVRAIGSALVGAVVLCGAGGPARADTKTSALSWVRLPGTESCIATPELGARIEKHLGRTVLVSPSVADISIEGRAEPLGTGAGRRFRVVVGGTRRDGTLIGTRSLTSPGSDCRALDDSLVLLIALMIDPDALAPAPPEPAPPAVSTTTEVTHEIIHERVIREIDHVPATTAPWLVDGSLRGLVAFGRTPGTAGGAALALTAGPTRRVMFQVSLGVVGGGQLTIGSAAVDYTIIEGGLAYCPSFALGPRLALGGCAGLRVGDVHSRGAGFASTRAVDRGLADLAIGPQLAIGIAGPVFALASVTGLIHLVRQQTTATDSGGRAVVLDDPGIFGGELGLGIGVHFSP